MKVSNHVFALSATLDALDDALLHHGEARLLQELLAIARAELASLSDEVEGPKPLRSGTATILPFRPRAAG